MTIQEKLNALRDRRAHVTEKLKQMALGLGAEECFSEDQQVEFDGLESEVGQIDTSIEALQRVQKLEAEAMVVSTREDKQATVTSFAGAIRGPEAKTEFESSAEFLEAVIVNGGRDQRLHYQEFGADQEMKTGSKGGFAVPEQFRDEFLSVDMQGEVIRPRAFNIPAGSPPDAEISMPALSQNATDGSYGGVSLTWTDVEKDSDIPETEAKIQEIKLKPHAIAGLLPVTNKLLRNWGAASTILTSLLRDALTHARERAFLIGSGAGEPLGLNSSANGSMIAINRATANTVTYADLVNMEASVIGDPVWIISPRALPKIRLMEDGAGHLIFTDAAAGLPAMLMGYPVIVNRRSGALGALGDVILADLKLGYMVKEGSGPYIDVSEHAEFKKDRTLIRVVANVDGQPRFKEAIQDLDETSSVSPIVSLDVPA